jgi:hypothetical protein
MPFGCSFSHHYYHTSRHTTQGADAVKDLAYGPGIWRTNDDWEEFAKPWLEEEIEELEDGGAKHSVRCSVLNKHFHSRSDFGCHAVAEVDGQPSV